MKIFIFEHLCSGCAAGDDISPHLIPMGSAMLSATIADFVAMGAHVTTMLDARIPLELPGAHVTRVSSETHGRSVFEELSHEADVSLIIAPESDGILEQWLENLESRDCTTLNSTLAATRLCADKLLMADHLKNAGIPTPATMLLQNSPDGQFPLVVKPRWGAGSEWTFVCHQHADMEAIPRWADWITQPLVAGMAVSCGVLVIDGKATALLPGEQIIQGSRRLHYRGGKLPVDAAHVAPAQAMAQRAAASVEGLRGYVGVDMILPPSEADDPVVIEINARITMSYPALAALCEQNLAAAMTGAIDPGRLTWRNASLRFTPQGQIIWKTPPNTD